LGCDKTRDAAIDRRGAPDRKTNRRYQTIRWQEIDQKQRKPFKPKISVGLLPETTAE
jgi:hypothetical protein